MQKNQFNSLSGNLQAPFDFSKHSSIGCGGSARYALYPRSVEELIQGVESLQKQEIPYLVLGNLTNVLPSDEGYDGVVLRTTKLDGVVLSKGVFVYAGTLSSTFLRVCRQAKLGGGEFLHGIPCTLGGALYMNAGASGSSISELVESVLVLREGKQVSVPLSECGYAYKKSIFMENGDIILGASLHLTPTTEVQIAEQIAYYAQKRAHLPKGRSMGCVFKNPENGFAGGLIEGCGLKGLRLGGATIATEHANFILNEGGATSKDIRTLITLIKNAVYAQYGVRLQEEIRLL